MGNWSISVQGNARRSSATPSKLRLPVAAGLRSDDQRQDGLHFANVHCEVVLFGKASIDQSRHSRRHRTAHRLVDGDRKSTRLNSSHLGISYAVFCLKT